MLSFQLGEPSANSLPGTPVCNPHGDPPVFGDCWYNCTLEDISGADKKQRLRKVSILVANTSYWQESICIDKANLFSVI